MVFRIILLVVELLKVLPVVIQSFKDKSKEEIKSGVKSMTDKIK